VVKWLDHKVRIGKGPLGFARFVAAWSGSQLVMEMTLAIESSGWGGNARDARHSGSCANVPRFGGLSGKSTGPLFSAETRLFSSRPARNVNNPRKISPPTPRKTIETPL
jgi:hypothetical protein